MWLLLLLLPYHNTIFTLQCDVYIKLLFHGINLLQIKTNKSRKHESRTKDISSFHHAIHRGSISVCYWSTNEQNDWTYNKKAALSYAYRSRHHTACCSKYGPFKSELINKDLCVNVLIYFQSIIGSASASWNCYFTRESLPRRKSVELWNSRYATKINQWLFLHFS